MSTTLSFPFTTAGNYTASDGAAVEVSGGNGTLVDLRETDTTFAATYTSSVNGSYGDGSLTGTLAAGTPTVSGGFLVLDGTEYVTYDAASNLASGNIYTIRIILKPGYSGTPGARQTFFLSDDSASNNNKIEIYHETDGRVYYKTWDSGGSAQHNKSFSWSPTSGTEYEFELNVDSTNNRSNLFLDGVLQAAQAKTFTRAQAASGVTLEIGDGNGAQNFSVNYWFIFDTEQHTAGYTPSGTMPAETAFSPDDPTLTTVATVSGGLKSFTSSVAETGSDLIKFVLRVAGTDKYWDGSAWSTSTGYAQSNTTAEINDNITMLDAGNSSIKIKVYIHSEDGSSTPTIDTMSITFDAADASATEPTSCYFEGFLYDFNGPVSGQLIEVRPTEGFNNGEIFISHAWQTFDTTGTDGYFAGYIWESTSVGKTYEFRYGTKKFRVAVPNADSGKWSDQTITVVSE